jgi:hypothetical protein
MLVFIFLLFVAFYYTSPAKEKEEHYVPRIFGYKINRESPYYQCRYLSFCVDFIMII